MNILQIDSSARIEGSQSRLLTNRLVAAFGESANVTRRDLADPVAQIDAAWIAANNMPVEARTALDRQALALSDALVDELEEADVVVIGLPVYNFSVPAALKAWIDQVCRARRTFEYTENGPRGLLSGKKAYVVYTSGGTAFGSDIDFASGYLRHVLGFIGIHDASFIDAGQHMMKPGAIEHAAQKVDALAGHAKTAKAA